MNEQFQAEEPPLLPPPVANRAPPLPLALACSNAEAFATTAVPDQAAPPSPPEETDRNVERAKLTVPYAAAAPPESGEDASVKVVLSSKRLARAKTAPPCACGWWGDEQAEESAAACQGLFLSLFYHHA